MLNQTTDRNKSYNMFNRVIQFDIRGEKANRNEMTYENIPGNHILAVIIFKKR